MPCPPLFDAHVSATTRMSLELAGYDVIDTEILNVEHFRRFVHDGAIDRRGGSAWSDAAPAEQRALLSAIGARGVLATDVSIDGPHGVEGGSTITVALTVRRVEDGVLAWQSRCAVSTGLARDYAQAIELATRCALESSSLW